MTSPKYGLFNKACLTRRSPSKRHLVGGLSYSTSIALNLLCTVPAPSHQTAIEPILSTLSVSNMQGWLTTLSAFNNRYYTATTGQQSAQFIYDTVSGVRYPDIRDRTSTERFNNRSQVDILELQSRSSPILGFSSLSLRRLPELLLDQSRFLAPTKIQLTLATRRAEELLGKMT